MNERIFELAKQADLIQWDTLSSGARTPDHASVVKARKFAQLIVRECEKVIRAEIAVTDIDGEAERAWEMGMECGVGLIKEHFGVEE
jgi:hypothetical protein